MFSLVIFLAVEMIHVLELHQLTKYTDSLRVSSPPWTGRPSPRGTAGPEDPRSEQAGRQHAHRRRDLSGSAQGSLRDSWRVARRQGPLLCDHLSVGWGDSGSWLTWHAGPHPGHSLFPVECPEVMRGNRVSRAAPGRAQRETPPSFYPREGSDTITDKSEQRSQYEFN